jgi:hypothetical protein
MPDKADPLKFPSLPDGSSQVGFAGIVVEKGRVRDNTTRYVYPLSERIIAQLDDKKGALVAEAYHPASPLYHEIPRLALYASNSSPLNAADIQRLLADGLTDEMLGKKLADDLVKAGMIQDHSLRQIVVFVASGFKKLGTFYIVSDWTLEVPARSGAMQAVGAQQQPASLVKPVQPAGTPAESSPLITPHAAELAALRRLGERRHIGFSLQKTVRPQGVGDIALRLTRTNPKRQTYTVDIFVDDKLIEKKDKVVNQAVGFYVAKSRQPYELIITRIEKDRIEGYLSVPASPQPGTRK